MKGVTWISRGRPNTGGWKTRHNLAVDRAFWLSNERSQERSIVQALHAWYEYASAYVQRFGGPIGENYVIGAAWARWGLAIRELLNGDCGQLDRGTLDTIILDNLIEQGFDPDKM